MAESERFYYNHEENFTEDRVIAKGDLFQSVAPVAPRADRFSADVASAEWQTAPDRQVTVRFHEYRALVSLRARIQDLVVSAETPHTWSHQMAEVEAIETSIKHQRDSMYAKGRMNKVSRRLTKRRGRSLQK